MSSTLFQMRLQKLKESKKYSEHLIAQFEDVAQKNNGKPPKKFSVNDVGRRELSNFLYDLGISNFEISAPNGASSSERAIVLYER
jgi:hypothetical protein